MEIQQIALMIQNVILAYINLRTQLTRTRSEIGKVSSELNSEINYPPKLSHLGPAISSIVRPPKLVTRKNEETRTLRSLREKF